MHDDQDSKKLRAACAAIEQLRDGAVLRKGFAHTWTFANNGAGGLGAGYGHLRWCSDDKTVGVDTFECTSADWPVAVPRNT